MFSANRERIVAGTFCPWVFVSMRPLIARCLLAVVVVCWIADESSATPGLSCAGDFNDDGTCDTADYVVWRKNVGRSVSLPNEVAPFGVVSAADYLSWRANFGIVIAASGGGELSGTQVTPEPAGWTLGLIGVAAICALNRRQRHS